MLLLLFDENIIRRAVVVVVGFKGLILKSKQQYIFGIYLLFYDNIDGKVYW